MYHNIAKMILITASSLLALILLRRLTLDFIFSKFKIKIRLPRLRAPRIRLPKISFKFRKGKKEKQIKLPFNEESLKNTRDRANQFFVDKKFKESEKLYLELVQKMPFDGQIYSRLGIIYLALKQYADARSSLERAIELGGKIPARYYNLAIAHLKLREKAKAKEAIKKALELKPGDQKYQNFLASMLEN